MKYEPQFPTNFSGDWNLAIANSDKNFDHLKSIDDTQKAAGQLLHRYFHVSVADGRAFYQVTKVTKTTATVTLCEGIDLDGYSDYVIGRQSTLPINRVQEFITRRDNFEKIFGS